MDLNLIFNKYLSICVHSSMPDCCKLKEQCMDAQIYCCGLNSTAYVSALAIYVSEPQFLNALHTAMESQHTTICSTTLRFLSHLLQYQMILQHIDVSIFIMHMCYKSLGHWGHYATSRKGVGSISQCGHLIFQLM